MKVKTCLYTYQMSGYIVEPVRLSLYNVGTKVIHYATR